MPKEIIKIWNFFKKAVVKWKYLKSKNKFRVCLEGTKKEFKENFSYEFKEETVPPTPTVKQLLLEHIKDFKNFKVSVESRLDNIDNRLDKQEEFNNQQKQFNNKIIKRLDNLENDVQHLKKDVLNIKKDMKIVKSVPIIKETFKKQK